jgi:hypothetical protein
VVNEPIAPAEGALSRAPGNPATCRPVPLTLASSGLPGDGPPPEVVEGIWSGEEVMFAARSRPVANCLGRGAPPPVKPVGDGCVEAGRLPRLVFGR